MEPLQNIKLTFKCPKQLNELQSRNGDWYCDGCHKIVRDFRGMGEQQIIDIITNNEYQNCGIFEASRIEVLPQHGRWFKWASAVMVFLGMTGLHQRLYAQVHKPVNPSTIKKNIKPTATLGEAVIQPDSINTNFVLGGVGTEPEFIGGEAALRRYLSSHIKYVDGFTGRVYVQFVVATDGSLTDIKILRGGNKQANDQVINAVKAMPKWKAGIQNGKPYRVQYTLPVNFSLQ